MKIASRILMIFWTLSLFILTIYLALIPTIFNRSFCENEFVKNNTAMTLNMSEEELNKAIDKTLAYLDGKSDTLHFEVTMKDGTVREFYEVTVDPIYPYAVHDEYAHMEEVRNIFLTSKSIAFLALIVLISSSILLWTQRKNNATKIFKYSYITYGVLLAFAIAIGLYAAIDFNAFFTTFHHVFFHNGNWTFNYNSLMLNMFDALLFGILYQAIIVFIAETLIVLTLIISLNLSLKKYEALN